MLLFFHFWENGHKQHFLFGAPKDFAPRFFSPLFGERKESPPRQKKRAALHFRLTPKAPYPLAPSSFPNCDRSAGSQFGSGERPLDSAAYGMSEVCDDDSERREQSVALFRTVGMEATDGGRPGFSGEILGLRSALCPLSFLGRLNPFFSFWQRKKRTGSKRRSFGCGGTYGDGLLVLLDID